MKVQFPQSPILTDLENCKKLELDPVLVSAGGQLKSRMSTPLTSRPNSSDGGSITSSTSAGQSSPGKISNLFKQALSNRNNVALDKLKKKTANVHPFKMQMLIYRVLPNFEKLSSPGIGIA